MKRSLIFSISFLLCFMLSFNANAQLQRIANKVKNQTVNRVLGNSEPEAVKADTIKKEPDCACDDAKKILVFDQGILLDYKEASFSANDEGEILIYNKLDQKYYTIKDGVKSGPYEQNDPVVRKFDLPGENYNDEQKIADLMARYKGMIVPSGEKYSIKFAGKTYGPYAVISSFCLNQSKTKFAAIVTANMMMTEAQAKSIEERMKNASSDQERMAISMEMSEQMQKTMMEQGGQLDIAPKIVSNIPNAKYEISSGSFSSKIKYDEIVFLTYDRITDLTGKLLKAFNPQLVNPSNGLWLSSDNTQIATFDHGTLTMGDDKVCTEVFCPYLIKAEGKVYLSYMYFSPANNAIMQCKTPF